MSEDTLRQLAHHGLSFLSQFDHSEHIAPPFIGSIVNARVILSSNDVLLNQIFSGGDVDHNILI